MFILSPSAGERAKSNVRKMKGAKLFFGFPQSDLWVSGSLLSVQVDILQAVLL